MKRVLVTGAQGFVGRWLVHTLCHSPLVDAVMGVGRSARNDTAFTHPLHWQGRALRAPLPPALLATAATPGRYDYRALDLCDSTALARLLADFAPHWVFHMASGLRDDSPGHLCRSNVEGSTVLTQALIDARQRPERVVVGSSGSVYGRALQLPGDLPLREDAATEPTTLYGATKLAAEHTTALLARQHGLPVVWARLFNLVGPGQDERHVCGRFAASLAALQGARTAQPLQVGPLSSTRDFIDVRDAAQALLLLAHSGPAGQVVNVASGVETPIGDVLQALLQSAGLTHQVRVFETAPTTGDVDRHVADITRLSALGFVARFGLRQSLQDLLAYYADCVAPQALRQTLETP
jgi:nucleoside-diphosphate-sugar epimerase